MLLMVTTPSASSCWAAILAGKMKVKSSSTVSGFDFAFSCLELPPAQVLSAHPWILVTLANTQLLLEKEGYK